MGTIKYENSRMIEKIPAVCLPLFIGNYFFADGHNQESTNATITFINFQNIIYGVTCKHVHDEVHKVKHSTARIIIGNVVQNLSGWSHFGLESYISDVAEDIDISIIKISENIWREIQEKKKRTFIDLDYYEEPDWSNIKSCIAAGFPNKSKSIQGNQVAASKIEITAELASNLTPSSKTFTIFSTLESPSPHNFSGISGGPIYCINDHSFLPIGIVYEGFPSGEEENARNSESFYHDNDITVRGIVINPNNFQEWLVNAKRR